MKAILLSFLMYLLVGITTEQQFESNESSDASTALLTFENTDHELLNSTVFQLINEERIKRKLDTLQFNSSLYQLARKKQSNLEFRTFKNAIKIQTKINKKLEIKAKNIGYKGVLVTSVASQHNALDYEKGKVFFHVKNDKTNKLGLYYGTKKDLKNPTIFVNKIPNYTYLQFATSLLKNLSSKQKKMLYSKSYTDIGLQLNWYYKSLHKRKIPQIKFVAILGGYVTAGMR
ncbi:MAG: hypothetical protein ACJAZ2_002151 [Glaciecola sp.]|jgi:hypothetical protein